MNTKEFIEKAKIVHNNKYDYSNSVYIKPKIKIEIICPKHGSFFQNYYDHLKGKGCKKCACEATSKRQQCCTNDFIEKARLIHGEKYDYSLVNYESSSKKINIICKTHGVFQQTPNAHLQGNECPKCAVIKSHISSKKSLDTFIKEASLKHNNFYDYSKTEYINTSTKITVTCPSHGDFQVIPYKHIKRGDGCPICRYIKSASSNKLTTSDFIEKANKIHNWLYNYSKTIYKSYNEKCIIICKKHGEFLQTPDSHLQGSGCPKCSYQLSKGENEIFNFIQSILPNEIVNNRNRNVINKQELDIFIPSYNLAIEFNGLRWHSEQFGKNEFYHLNKTKECEKNNIHLIQIFEDEYAKHKDVVLSKISYALFKTQNFEKIMGRKCQIQEIGMLSAKIFIENNSLYPFENYDLCLGALYNNNIVGLITLTEKNDTWLITNLVPKRNTILQGVWGKIFNFFIKNYKRKTIECFCDRTWANPFKTNVLERIGFKIYGETQPSFSLYNSSQPFDRINPSLISEKNLINYSKIWDCGQIHYIFDYEKEK